MQSIKLHSHIGANGILHLELPVGITDTEIEVTVTVKAVNSVTKKNAGCLVFLKK